MKPKRSKSLAKPIKLNTRSISSSSLSCLPFLLGSLFACHAPTQRQPSRQAKPVRHVKPATRPSKQVRKPLVKSDSRNTTKKKKAKSNKSLQSYSSLSVLYSLMGKWMQRGNGGGDDEKAKPSPGVQFSKKRLWQLKQKYDAWAKQAPAHAARRVKWSDYVEVMKWVERVRLDPNDGRAQRALAQWMQSLGIDRSASQSSCSSSVPAESPSAETTLAEIKTLITCFLERLDSFASATELSSSNAAVVKGSNREENVKL